jgi:pimeloyl-ACP methyl ester carboxylesterase
MPMSTLTATLHDGSSIPIHVAGAGPAVLLPVRLEPFDDATAATMRAWGADPALGRTLVDGLAPRFRVIAADYEGHRMAHPAAGTLTPDAIAADVLSIADAAGADTFAWYGYSWLALAGLQVAIRTDRLWALAMGGFPPLGGPYPEMLLVTRAAHAASVAAAGSEPAPDVVVEPGDWDAATIRTSEAQTGQFMTMYEALVGFDERAALARVACPALAFAGDADRIEYGPLWVTRWSGSASRSRSIARSSSRWAGRFGSSRGWTTCPRWAAGRSCRSSPSGWDASPTGSMRRWTPSTDRRSRRARCWRRCSSSRPSSSCSRTSRRSTGSSR